MSAHVVADRGDKIFKPGLHVSGARSWLWQTGGTIFKPGLHVSVVRSWLWQTGGTKHPSRNCMCFNECPLELSPQGVADPGDKIFKPELHVPLALSAHSCGRPGGGDIQAGTTRVSMRAH